MFEEWCVYSDYMLTLLTDNWYLMSLVHTCSSPTTQGISSVFPFRLSKALKTRTFLNYNSCYAGAEGLIDAFVEMKCRFEPSEALFSLDSPLWIPGSARFSPPPLHKGTFWTWKHTQQVFFNVERKKALFCSLCCLSLQEGKRQIQQEPLTWIHPAMKTCWYWKDVELCWNRQKSFHNWFQLDSLT